MEIHPVVPKLFTHLAIFCCRVRNNQISAFPFHKLTDLRSVVTLEVTGRFFPDFACLISHFVSLCTPKIMVIYPVVPKKIIYLATLGFRIC